MSISVVAQLCGDGKNAVGHIVGRKSKKPYHNLPDGVLQVQALDHQAVYVDRNTEFVLCQ